VIQAMGKSFAKILSAWTDGTSRMFIATLVDVMSWKVALSLALTLFLSLTQGIQLLLLVPLMQLIGLDVQQGSIGWLSKLVSSAFSVVGIRPSLITVLGALVFFTTGLSLITRWQNIFNLRLEQEFVASLRRRLYRAIANTEWLLFSKTRSSELTHSLTIELSRTGSAVGVLLTLVTNAILVSVYILLALQLSLAMTTVVFVSGAGLLLVQRRKTRAARWTGEELSLASNGLYSAAIEHLAGMKTTKSYGAEERSASIFSQLADRVSRMFVESTRVYAGTTFWFNTGSVVILSIILYISIEFLNMASASLILLLFLFNRMIPLFNALQNSYQYYVNAMPAFAGVVAFLDRFEAAAETKTTESTEVELHRAINLQNTSFSYGAEEKAPAIRDLNLIIEAGKTTAIVGPSGAGKSTVADLVMGLIVPTRGEIRVDGVLLRTALMQSWRARIGYVAQDTFLFNDTVRANLLWAHPGASEEEIWEALELAAAKEFASELPQGLETVLGDRGVRLSGGERQRLALARALLRRPSLLILDEATSALDSENERRIRRAIEDLHGMVTMLVITHRLTTVRAADEIYVLERGRLVERGDWEQLMRKVDGRFRTLAEAQGVG
jgi:ATP-binding cassette subfamily C protein